MSTAVESKWITGEEIGREWRKLAAQAHPLRSTEMKALIGRIDSRDNFLYETYGKRHLESDRNRWIAISVNGEVLIRDTSSEAICDATETFGAGNFAMRRLNDFPGHELLA
jgi:hypothetical protein